MNIPHHVRISGPVFVSAFTLGKTNIILFGDEHFKKTGLCRSCKKDVNCLYVNDFIENLKNPLDIFVESQWKNDANEKFTSLPPEDVISNVINKYGDNMYHHKQQYNGRRVHYVDVRNDNTLYGFLMILLSLILKSESNPLHNKVKAPFELLQRFSKTQDFKDFANILVESDDFNKAILKKFGKTWSQYFIGKDNLTNIPGSHLRTINRIRKQILKLSVSNRDALLKFHKDRCKEIVITTKVYNDINDNSKYSTDEKEFIIFDTILLWMSHIMDMYTLARMLHYMNNNYESHSVVVYAGAHHTENYSTFFSRYLHATAIEYQSYDNKRCVTLPAFFTQKVCKS